jgi:hypothetical protein
LQRETDLKEITTMNENSAYDLLENYESLSRQEGVTPTEFAEGLTRTGRARVLEAIEYYHHPAVYRSLYLAVLQADARR